MACAMRMRIASHIAQRQGQGCQNRPNPIQYFTFYSLSQTSQVTAGPLGLLGRPAAASRFGRPGKSAAAAAITTSTQGVNEHQIELLG